MSARIRAVLLLAGTAGWLLGMSLLPAQGHAAVCGPGSHTASGWCSWQGWGPRWAQYYSQHTASRCLTGTVGVFHRPNGAGNLDWATSLAFVPECNR